MSEQPVSFAKPPKGTRVSLTKEVAAKGLLLTDLLVGLGWDNRITDGDDFDLDASAFMVGADGKVSSSADFLYYNKLKSDCSSVECLGDNKTGAGDGDDERIKINLATLPAHVKKIIIAVSIHDAEKRKQNFGQVSNAYISVTNGTSNEMILKFDLSEESSAETSMIFGEIYRTDDGEWKFNAVGQGFAGGLSALAASYGVAV